MGQNWTTGNLANEDKSTWGRCQRKRLWEDISCGHSFCVECLTEMKQNIIQTGRWTWYRWNWIHTEVAAENQGSSITNDNL